MWSRIGTDWILFFRVLRNLTEEWMMKCSVTQTRRTKEEKQKSCCWCLQNHPLPVGKRYCVRRNQITKKLCQHLTSNETQRENTLVHHRVITWAVNELVTLENEFLFSDFNLWLNANMNHDPNIHARYSMMIQLFLSRPTWPRTRLRDTTRSIECLFVCPLIIWPLLLFLGLCEVCIGKIQHHVDSLCTPQMHMHHYIPLIINGCWKMTLSYITMAMVGEPVAAMFCSGHRVILHKSDIFFLKKKLCVDVSSLSPSTSRNQTQRDAGTNHDMSCVLHEQSQNSINQMCQQMLTRGFHCPKHVWSVYRPLPQISKSVNVELVANKSFETGSSRRSTSPVLWRLHLAFHWHISNMSPTFKKSPSMNTCA